jgi:hypothetical protein
MLPGQRARFIALTSLAKGIDDLDACLRKIRTVARASKLVSRLGCNRNEESFLRTSEQPIENVFVWSWCAAHQTVFAAIQPFDDELISRHDAVLPTQCGW